MSAQPEPLALPDRRVFWRWVWESVKPFVGWVLAAAGIIALFLGWWGVSGQSLTSKQLPYLASGGLAGVALVVLAAAFFASSDIRRQLVRLDEIERKVDELYDLLVDTAAPEAEPATASRRRDDARTLLALPTGSSYHRPDCALVTGKSSATPVDAAQIRSRSLAACRVCSPPTV